MNGKPTYEELEKRILELEERIDILTTPSDDTGGVIFEDLFDLDDIQRLQDEFAHATGVASMIMHLDGTPITRASNFCRLCGEIIRKTEKGRKNCQKSDAKIGELSSQGLVIQPCFCAGLWDAGAAISVGGRHIANWMIGQVRDETQTEDQIRAYAQEIGTDEEAMVEAFLEVPSMSREQFERIARMLYTLANQLSGIAYQSVQQKRFIIEHQRVEEVLKRSEAYLRTLVRTIPDLVWMKDSEGTYLFCNSRFECFFGAEEKDIVGKTDYDFVDRELADFFREHDKLAMAKGGPSKNEEEVIYAEDGHREILETIKTPIYRDDGQLTGVLGIGRDITERKEAERERLANLHFFESLDKVNRAIHGSSEPEQMMRDVLDVVLSIFDCDRAFLMYPCDPKSQTWTSPIERNKPEYPGVLELEKEMPMDPQVAETLRILLAADGPVTFGPGMMYVLPEDVSEQFGFKCFMSMAIYPKMGSPWQFGIHQCAYARVWTSEEMRVFEAIGRRLADGLTVLLTHRNLQESEEFLNNVVENIPNMIFVKDAEELRYVRFNKAGEELVGISREELAGKNDYDIFPKEMADFFTSKDREVLSRKTFLDISEEDVLTRSGDKRILQTKKLPILDGSGKPKYLLGISEDITERKESEQKLRQREATLAGILKTSPIGIGLTQGRVIQWVNENFLKLVGYSSDELIGKSARIFYESDEEFEQVGKLKYLAIVENGIGNIETRFQRKDGSLIDIYLSSAPINPDDIAAGVCFTAMDITERKQAEKKLQEASLIINQSPAVAFIWKNQEGWPVEFVSENVKDLCGYTEEEFRSSSVLYSNIIYPDDLARVSEEVACASLKKDCNHFTHEPYRIVTRDGAVKWIDDRTFVQRDEDGKVIHYQGVVLDITERKKLEEQLHQAQKMESVGRLAGGVAHDFNNMLGIIIGNSEMALEEVSPDQAIYTDLQEIRKAAQRSVNLTRQLLAFARQQTVAPQILDLSETVAGMIKMLRPLIGEDIDLVWQPGPEVWPVRMDPSQIDQVLANLCVNARDAIEGVGKITIETRNVVFERTYGTASEEFTPGDFVLLAVSDNGEGMDRKTLDNIFEPFFTTKELGKGTGLGLATVYGIVKQNEGFIRVSSQPGEGTTFKIYLPRQRAGSDLPLEDIPDGEAEQGHETILLVEDEKAMLQVTKTMLERLGYQVLSAPTPSEALRLVKEASTEIDLLISDVIMPEMNGRELANKIIACRPAVNCLFMSGYSGSIIAHQGALGEGADFIRKPFSKQVLAAKIRVVLGYPGEKS